MIKSIKVLQLLKETQGTNTKVNVLSEELRKMSADTTETFQTVLQILYNPTISTNIAKKKIEKEVKNVDCTLTTKEFLNWVQNECTGKDSDIAICQSFISKLPTEYQQIMKEIITQSFSCNMDYKLINRAFGYRFISVISPMLAMSWDKMNEEDKKCDFAVTVKLDGGRVMIFCNEDGTKIGYTRNGLSIEGFEDFLNKLDLPKGYVFDGELLPSNTEGLESKDQYKAIMKITRTKGKKDPELIRYNIFDCMTIDEYNSEDTKPYSERRKFLNENIVDTQYQRVVPVVKEINFEQDYEWLCSKLDEVVSQGQEGLMLNKLNSKYTFKRGRDIFKLKKFHTCDLRVVGIEEGDGKFKDMIGALIVDYKGNKLGVGSGLSDDFRKYYYKNKNELIGKIVEISYFEETKNDKGNFSLRFPCLLCIRTDKKEVSYD